MAKHGGRGLRVSALGQLRGTLRTFVGNYPIIRKKPFGENVEGLSA
jgi:hypothetical protein